MGEGRGTLNIPPLGLFWGVWVHGQPSGLRSRGSGCPPGVPHHHHPRPGTESPPTPPLNPPSSQYPPNTTPLLAVCPSFIHLPSNLAGWTQMSGHLGEAAVGLQEELQLPPPLPCSEALYLPPICDTHPAQALPSPQAPPPLKAAV